MTVDFKARTQGAREAVDESARADREEIIVAHHKDRISELVDTLRKVTRERDQSLQGERDVIALLTQRTGQYHAALNSKQDQDAVLARVLRECAELRAEERDASKLRRQLREAEAEIASLQERVRRLEGGGEVGSSP